MGSWSDDAHYIVLAQSLATGHGFMLVNYPNPQPEIFYPAGYPFLISPLVAVLPFDFAPLKLVSTMWNFGNPWKPN